MKSQSLNSVQKFLNIESSSVILLFGATVLALILDSAKLEILVASVVAGILGYFMLKITSVKSFNDQFL